MKYLPFALLFAVAFSCGKKDTSHDPEEEEVLRFDGSNIKGVYQAQLKALNVNSTLVTVGAAGLHRESDIFKAFVKLYIGDKGVIHKQSIHTGTRCPTLEDDVNSDGYIDEREAQFVVGNIIVPLDGDLDSQAGGNNAYPVGNGLAGGYFYERSASFSRMFADLHDLDSDTLDEIDKIPYGRGFSFNKKVILIHGAGSQIRIPDSVNTVGNSTRARSLPIACGILTRSKNFPSELYDRSDPLTRSPFMSRTDSRYRFLQLTTAGLFLFPKGPARV